MTDQNKDVVWWMFAEIINAGRLGWSGLAVTAT
jgi:hypothetical protein